MPNAFKIYFLLIKSVSWINLGFWEFSLALISCHVLDYIHRVRLQIETPDRILIRVHQSGAYLKSNVSQCAPMETRRAIVMLL